MDVSTSNASAFEIDFARALVSRPSRLGATTDDQYATALARLVGQFDALVDRLASQDAQHGELQTALKIARSNLVLAEANADALEEALRRRGGTTGASTLMTTPELSQGAWETSSTASSPRDSSDKSLPFWKRRNKASNGLPVPITMPPARRSPNPGDRSPTASEAGPGSPTIVLSHAACDAEIGRLKAQMGELQAALERGRRAADEHGRSHETLRSTHATLAASHDKLQTEHAELQATHRDLQTELETLSQALFEEANKMVADERRERSRLEDEVFDLRAQLDDMRIVAEQQLEAQLGLMGSPNASATEQLPTPDESLASPAASPRVDRPPPRVHSLHSKAVDPVAVPSPPSSPRLPPTPLLQQSPSLRKTIPTAVRAASPGPTQSEFPPSIDEIVATSITVERPRRKSSLTAADRPRGIVVPTEPSPKLQSSSRFVPPSESPPRLGSPLLDDSGRSSPSPTPSPVLGASGNRSRWLNAFGNRPRGKSPSPSIDDALASIAADAECIASSPGDVSLTTRSPRLQSLAARTEEVPTPSPTEDAVELGMDELDTLRGSSRGASSSTSPATQPSDDVPAKDAPFDDLALSLDDPPLRSRRRPAGLTERPAPFVIPTSSSSSSLAYADSHGSREESDQQRTPRLLDDTGFHATTPLAASHGARLLDNLLQHSRKGSNASSTSGSICAASTRTSATSDRILAAMAFPHRGDVPSALRSKPAVGLLATTEAPRTRNRSASNGSNASMRSNKSSRLNGASSPLGDLEAVMAEIAGYTHGLGIESEGEDGELDLL